MTFAITKCRVCKNADLRMVVDLGIQYLTGVFPRAVDSSSITKGPLELVKCFGGEDVCGLVQLRHSFPATEMYGETYGYRSGLNTSMVNHLQSKVSKIEELISLNSDSLIIDIGSNDGTTLAAYQHGPRLIGIDPAAKKYSSYYPDHVEFIPDFFSADLIQNATNGKRASVVTSFAMMYDLEDPVSFAKEVASILHQDGIWMFEQSYLPSMVESMAYDTICHEHIEYYSLKAMKYLIEQNGLEIVDVFLDDINGGSLITSIAHPGVFEVSSNVTEQLKIEKDFGLMELSPYKNFEEGIHVIKDRLVSILNTAKDQKKRVAIYGASTRGATIWQYLELGPDLIESAVERQPEKIGKVFSAIGIPIISEEQMRLDPPDYLLVGPWFLRESFVQREKDYLSRGGTFIFPLPKVELVDN